MLMPLLLACSTGSDPEPGPPVHLDEDGTSQVVPSASPNLVVILIDTLRSDALAAADTPNIDHLIHQGAMAEHAWSAGTWTVPSIMSLFTGMSVREHGWDEPSARIGHYPVMFDHPTLAEVLHQEGFETTGFYANPYLAEDLGMERGFDTWRRSGDAQIPQLFNTLVATQWSESDKPQFTYLHLLGPHSPLKPSESARQKWQIESTWFDEKRGLSIGAAKRNQKPGVREAYKKAYHAAIEDTDERIGEILKSLDSHLRPTWVLLTSDHGELLGEHGIVGHGSHLYQGLTEVPFILTPPEGVTPLALPSVLNNAVLPDVACTVLGLQCSWANTLSGTSPLVSQREGMLALSPAGTHKAIWSKEPAQYNLTEDPTETRPLPITADLLNARERWWAATPAGSPGVGLIEIEEENASRLRALGYQE